VSGFAAPLEIWVQELPLGDEYGIMKEEDYDVKIK
jgi:hypothetical protein